MHAYRERLLGAAYKAAAPLLSPPSSRRKPASAARRAPLERPRPILQRQHGHDFEAQDMSAGSGPSCSLLSGSDPVEAIEQENGVPVDDVLRPVNSFHGAFKSAQVHALGLAAG
ncbi:MAG: hypothetical protein WA231_17860 [Methylocella sp.]